MSYSDVYQQNTIYQVNRYHPLIPFQQTVPCGSPSFSNSSIPRSINNAHNINPNQQNHNHIQRKHLRSPQEPTDSCKEWKLFLATTRIIHWPLSKELLEFKRQSNETTRAHKPLVRAHTNFEGIYCIGGHLWVKGTGLSESKYWKINAITQYEWSKWIPKQIKYYINAWKRSTAYTLAATHLNPPGTAFRYRFKSFIDAMKAHHIKNNIPNNKHLYSCRNNNQTNQLQARRNANGELLPIRKLPEYKQRRCKYGIYCSRSQCPFLHKQCRSGNQCTAPNCQYIHSVSEGAITPQKRRFNSTEDRYYKKRKMHENHNRNEIKMEQNEGLMAIDDSKAEKVLLTCANCKRDLRNKELWRCSKCKVVYYCGKQCQTIHWKIHNVRCGVTLKIEKVSVFNWKCYAIIYWLNRVKEGRFNGIKYRDLKKHMVIGKIRGCELKFINKVMLRMMGIDDCDEQKMTLDVISDVVNNDNFNNEFANIMNVHCIPEGFLDPVLYELMEEPMRVMGSGYIYDKWFITKYVAENKCDPMSGRVVNLNDIEECEGLKKEIEIWREKCISFQNSKEYRFRNTVGPEFK